MWRERRSYTGAGHSSEQGYRSNNGCRGRSEGFACPHATSVHRKSPSCSIGEPFSPHKDHTGCCLSRQGPVTTRAARPGPERQPFGPPGRSGDGGASRLADGRACPEQRLQWQLGHGGDTEHELVAREALCVGRPAFDPPEPGQAQKDFVVPPVTVTLGWEALVQ